MKVQKLKFNKLATLALLTLTISIICTKESYAFIAAGTIGLLAVAIGGFLKQLVIIIIAFLISLFVVKNKKNKKIKKITKKIVIGIVIIFILITAGWFGIHFYEIYKLNTPKISTLDFIEASETPISEEFLKTIIKENKDVLDHKTILDIEKYCSKHTKLENKIECKLLKMIQKINSDIDEKLKFNIEELLQETTNNKVIFSIYKNYNIKNSIYLKNYFSLYNDITELHRIFSPYQNKTILIYCSQGGSGRALASFLQLHGYNAKGFGFSSITDFELIDMEDMTTPNEQSDSVIILPFEQRNKNKDNFYIRFVGGDDILEQIKNTIKPAYIIPLFEEKNWTDLNSDEEYIAKMSHLYLNYNAICNRPVECLFNQQIILKLNLSKQVNKIYKTEIDYN